MNPELYYKTVETSSTTVSCDNRNGCRTSHDNPPPVTTYFYMHERKTKKKVLELGQMSLFDKMGNPVAVEWAEDHDATDGYGAEHLVDGNQYSEFKDSNLKNGASVQVTLKIKKFDRGDAPEPTARRRCGAAG